MSGTCRNIALVAVAAIVLLTLSSAVTAQQRGRGRGTTLPATLGLEDGYLDLQTPQFKVRLVKASQTLVSLSPVQESSFDFAPADRLNVRAANGFNHLGDLTFRVRENDSAPWQNYSTSAARQPVKALETDAATLAAADLSATLPADCPLQITRSWRLLDGKLVLHFDIKNRSNGSVEIGALGIPVVFNNMITGRSLQQAHEICSFFDPYIGLDAGYLQVTRLSGHGPALVVAPEGKTPFEAYRLLNEPTRPSQTFEGTFEWMVHSLAYAENEWKNAKPWNPPTSVKLAPGKSVSHGVTFLLSDEIRHIEDTLAAAHRPVAVGIPGYILPMDLDGKLFLNSSQKIQTIESDPPGTITSEEGQPTKNGWKQFTLRGKSWGRAQLLITYADGTKQSVSYYITKPASEAVADLGHFLFTKQWFVDDNDPFHRSPSVMSYNRAADKLVTQDSRVWIAGLGDEGGSGSWLAAAMKEFGQPNPEELAKYEQFVDKVLWGGIQYKEGPRTYGVRKSLFYYDPKDRPDFQYNKSLNWGSWTSWNKTASEAIDRAYNYPHVVAAYWSMYRLARNHDGLVINHKWDWYLDHAYQTIKFLTSRNANGRYNVGYLNTGLMEGDIFLLVLEDLKREGWTQQATQLETQMKARADRWSQQAFPFGSEMAWDSTGQEEVYAWTDYFGYHDKALVSLNSILGYMPTVPHWGYNGNARRYWDFIYGGAPGPTSRIERQIHHYGSGINAIPMLAQYREHPDDIYLLRVGYGGAMGAISSIDQEGFASAAFHSFPSTLAWDAYSGDYGPNFFGHAINTATYVVNHPEFGWQAFGGSVTTAADKITVKPLDSFRQKIYVAPLGLWLTLDAGTFDSIELNPATHSVRVGLSPADKFTSAARLRIESPAKIAGIGAYQPNGQFANERGAFTIPLHEQTTWVELAAGPK